MENQEASIEINPKIMMGKPVVKGTRITVELIVEQLAAGRSVDDLLESYPSLTRESIFAALQFAADHIRASYIPAIAS